MRRKFIIMLIAMIDNWHMKRLVVFCVLFMIFSTKNASAFYMDYMVRYNSTGCHMVNNETQCGPIKSSPQDKIVKCNFYFDTKACCCEGVVWIPDAPKNATAEVNDNSITLSWDDDPTADFYKIYWRGDDDYAYVGDKEIVVQDGNSFTHEGLRYNTTYAYKIIPFNAHTIATQFFSWCYSSTLARATTGSDPNPPPIQCTIIEVTGLDIQDAANDLYMRASYTKNNRPVWESKTHTIEFGGISPNSWEILLKPDLTGMAGRPALCDTDGNPGDGPFSCSNWREWRGGTWGFLPVPANFTCID